MIEIFWEVLTKSDEGKSFNKKAIATKNAGPFLEVEIA